MVNKKKILHIVESFGSGVFSFLVDLVNNTDEEFDIIIAYGKRDETLSDFKKYFSDRVEFIEVINFTRKIDFIKDLKAFIEIKKIIKKINPEIIHMHSSKAGFLGRFAADGKKIKMFYNPHGFSFLMQNSSKFKRCLYWLLEKIGSYRRCTVIGCSEGEFNEAKKITKDAICIDNGINTRKIDDIVLNLAEKKIDIENLTFCTSGRIGFQKNPMLFNKIAQKFPKNKFVWIGDGDLRDCLTADNIEITGWKTREEVLTILNKYDVFLLTSLWEGMPISLLEAMYLKKICIVTDCIGNKNLIKDGINGFLADNLDEFEIKIQKIINKKCDVSMIINNQLSDINEKYNIDIMTEKYKGEYRKEYEK